MSGVLVDTSVWVDHFRRPNTALLALLVGDMVLVHPLVLGEIACGTPPARALTLADLDQLQRSRQSSVRETIDFVDRAHLFGLGCGLVDMMLLTSTLLTPDAKLWSLDKRLCALAERHWRTAPTSRRPPIKKVALPAQCNLGMCRSGPALTDGWS